ncbi:MAG: dephospho-CoA kinase [Xanthomonadaceae bacterium]|nr:dephospho-CoA kinase [Xanthomonadaceae bacterium]
MQVGAFVIALTGGIATGKSATAQRFAQRGVSVFDADVAAHELVASGQPALAQIAAVFGAGMLTPTGQLDRARLRGSVFADASARRRLEAILHPRIRSVLTAQARTCRDPYCMLAIPLFAECRADYAWIDRVLCTDAPRAVQLARVLHRVDIDPATAQGMLDSQVSREERLALADDALDNTGPLPALDAAVARLHRRYLELAARKKT